MKFLFPDRMGSAMRSLFVICLLALTVVSLPAKASAQAALLAATQSAEASGDKTTADPSPDMSKEAIDAMVARMSDDQVRSMLLDRLDAVAAQEAAAPAKPTLFQQLTVLAQAFVSPLVATATGFGTMIEMEKNVLQQIHAELGFVGIWKLLLMLAISLAVGFAAEAAVRKVLQRMQGDVAPPAGDTLRDSILYLARRLFRQLIGLIVFFAVARLVGIFLHTRVGISIAHPFLLYMIMIPRISATLTRFVFAPEHPELRLVNCADHWARYLQRNLTGLFALMGLTLFIPAINFLFGGHAGEGISLSFLMNLAAQLYLAVIAWTAREGLRDIIRGTDPDRTRFDENMAYVYPYWIIGVDVFIWVVTVLAFGFQKWALLGGGATYVTLFWLVVLPALDTVIRGVVQHLVPPMTGDGAVARSAYHQAKRAYVRIGRMVTLILVLMIIAETWDMKLISFSGGVGPAAHFVNFLLTAAVGFVLYEAVSLYINRKLARESTDAQTLEEGGSIPEAAAGGEGGSHGGTSRLATVLPLVRMIAQAGIIVLFALLALGNLGIDITPLLAGAGIIGLAIGFGAQKLVSDIVSGVFFLVDDAFRVGEYVSVGSVMGTVEKISIRSMQLRHHRGILQTVPFGGIKEISNMSRDWVIMKLKFTVPFDTDPNLIKKLFKQIGKDIQADPLASDGLMETFKSQGVFDFNDVGMIVRGKFMARPGTQFTIRKEIYNKVKEAFAENGIEFARREVRIAMPEGQDFEDMTDEELDELRAKIAAGEAARAARAASE
ncbi:mechanosensitive ion channel family protein [Chachezhania sediminis]|uniref:mechanosensitive ion channel family protein n=1 Tax=Chachezhania sediminis TaxID=2599291 RepID=UPI001E414C95|nr:mechanosensitive ion channel family protein [Chachezhania sediminis]